MYCKSESFIDLRRVVSDWFWSGVGSDCQPRPVIVGHPCSSFLINCLISRLIRSLSRNRIHSQSNSRARIWLKAGYQGWAIHRWLHFAPTLDVSVSVVCSSGTALEALLDSLCDLDFPLRSNQIQVVLLLANNSLLHLDSGYERISHFELQSTDSYWWPGANHFEYCCLSDEINFFSKISI